MTRGALFASAALVIGATLAVYGTSFGGALVFDDIPGIQNNPTIRRLGWDQLLQAVGPQGGTLSGRPVPNLTLALNYAISGAELWSYHAVNLLIHVLASLALFGFARRTLSLPSLAPAHGEKSLTLALVIALLWALHPLQTESVTYLVQRVESLMGLCYLLTLYCFVRSVDSPRSRRWQAAAFTACLLGMGCKEVMVTAPVLVLLYDRTFVAGSWGAVWWQRRGFHAALLATWIVLAALVLATENRAGTAGLGTAVAWWQYSLTQTRAILHYLRLALWPEPLVFDYGMAVVKSPAEVVLPMVGLGLLLIATAWALVRRPVWGFAGAWFFVVLAPTSSVVPVATQTMAEHRLYVPLVAVVAFVVVGTARALGRALLPVWLVVAVVLGITTARRNLDYHSPLGLWADTARKLPGNGRAQNNTGAYLFTAGRFEEARQRFDTALQLDPTHASAHFNLGKLLAKTGRVDEAIAAYEAALHFDPKLADAHVNLGILLDHRGRAADAVPHFEEALRLDPGAADTHAALGSAWLHAGRTADAVRNFETALEIEPENAETWSELAGAQLELDEGVAARRAAEQALRLKPDFPAARYALGNIEAAAGNFPGAIAHYRRVVALEPAHVQARNNLANALLVNGQVDEAIVLYRQILAQQPGDAAVEENLAKALELKR